MTDTSTEHPFLTACHRGKTPYTPVWLMRQAGRYMKHYRDVRAKVSFLELCKIPDLVAEVTVTPVEHLNVDAAILFADILLLLEPMGVGLEYATGGPVIQRPVRTGGDVDGLRDPVPEESLSYVYAAVRSTPSGPGRTRAVDRILRRPFHAGVLSDRRRRLAQLHPHQAAVSHRPRRLERPHGAAGDGHGCLRQRGRSRPASTSSRSSIAG